MGIRQRTLSLAFTDAFLSRRSMAISLLLLIAASCSGVQPPLFFTLTSPLYFSRMIRAESLLLKTAQVWSGALPLLFFECTSAPFDSSSSAVSHLSFITAAWSGLFPGSWGVAVSTMCDIVWWRCVHYHVFSHHHFHLVVVTHVSAPPTIRRQTWRHFLRHCFCIHLLPLYALRYPWLVFLLSKWNYVPTTNYSY